MPRTKNIRNTLLTAFVGRKIRYFCKLQQCQLKIRQGTVLDIALILYS